MENLDESMTKSKIRNKTYNFNLKLDLHARVPYNLVGELVAGITRVNEEVIAEMQKLPQFSREDYYARLKDAMNAEFKKQIGRACGIFLCGLSRSRFATGGGRWHCDISTQFVGRFCGFCGYICMIT